MLARVVKIVLERAGEIRVAGARAQDGALLFRGASKVSTGSASTQFGQSRLRTKDGESVSRWFASGARRRGSRPDRSRSSCGRPGHSPAGGARARDRCPRGHRHAGGQAREGRHQAFAVRFASRLEAEHGTFYRSGEGKLAATRISCTSKYQGRPL